MPLGPPSPGAFNYRRGVDQRSIHIEKNGRALQFKSTQKNIPFNYLYLAAFSTAGERFQPIACVREGKTTHATSDFLRSVHEHCRLLLVLKLWRLKGVVLIPAGLLDGSKRW